VYQRYYFKIVKSQVPAARLGQLDYVINGITIGGFALLAFPAEYRVSGVKAFLVGYDGIVKRISVFLDIFYPPICLFLGKWTLSRATEIRPCTSTRVGSETGLSDFGAARESRLDAGYQCRQSGRTTLTQQAARP